MEKSVLWNRVFDYFEENTKDGFDCSLQLKLAEQIASSQYAEFLYPSTSHFNLILSPAENYNETLNLPSIAVQQIDEQRFEVIYSPKQSQTHNILKRTLHFSEVWSYLESLLFKLELNSRKNEID